MRADLRCFDLNASNAAAGVDDLAFWLCVFTKSFLKFTIFFSSGPISINASRQANKFNLGADALSPKLRLLRDNRFKEDYLF